MSHDLVSYWKGKIVRLIIAYFNFFWGNISATYISLLRLVHIYNRNTNTQEGKKFEDTQVGNEIKEIEAEISPKNKDIWGSFWENFKKFETVKINTTVIRKNGV